jgi:hypothetical protein
MDHEYEVLATVKGHSITHRFSGTITETEPGVDLIAVALTEASRQLSEGPFSRRDIRSDRKTPRAGSEDQAESGVGNFPKVAGRCPNCRRESLYLGAGGHVTCSFLGCGAPTLADEVLHDGIEAHAHELRARAESAEDRCLRAARAVDVRDHHARDLMAALTGGGHGLPWWMQATRSLESLDDLANSAQLEDDSRPLEKTLQRVGEMARDTVSD